MQTKVRIGLRTFEADLSQALKRSFLELLLLLKVALILSSARLGCLDKA